MPFVNGKAQDVFIKWPQDNNPQTNELDSNNNQYLIGQLWASNKVVFPDFLKIRTQNWWKDQIIKYYRDSANGLKFDG